MSFFSKPKRSPTKVEGAVKQEELVISRSGVKFSRCQKVVRESPAGQEMEQEEVNFSQEKLPASLKAEAFSPSASVPPVPTSPFEHKHRVAAASKQINEKDDPLKILQLPLGVTKCEFAKKIRVMEMGSNTGKDMRVLMILGATGAGKTTLINMLCNYIMGVDWDDDFRFNLVDESQIKKSQAESQTDFITSYVLHHHDGFRIPYSITIIDTPGYGDTRGPDRDKLITEQIRDFFGDVTGGMVDQLHGIGFVAQANDCRLNASTKFVFRSILSLFGKDMADAINILATKADSGEAKLVDALKKATVPYEGLFKFNNCALFANNVKPGANATTAEKSSYRFDTMFWEMGIESCEGFLACIADATPKSLEGTRTVLSERQLIETKCESISADIKVGLSHCEQIKQQIDVFKAFKIDADLNQKFTMRVPITVQKQVAMPVGQHTTHCLSCNRTCHENCKLPNDDEKAGCRAMTGKYEKSGNNPDRFCGVCPGRCHWSCHVNSQFKYEYVVEMQEQTNEDMKRTYAEKLKGRTDKASVINAMVQTFEEIQLKVLKDSRDVRDGLSRLREIALREDPLSHLDYIDQMILAEKQECEPGWQERISQLYELRKQAEHLDKLKDPTFDPFSQYKQPDRAIPREQQEFFAGIKTTIFSFMRL